MNLLNDCSEEEQDTAMDPNRKRSTSNLSALRNCTVQAMSNLLNANIDSGLMHSIGTYGSSWKCFTITMCTVGLDISNILIKMKFVE